MFQWRDQRRASVEAAPTVGASGAGSANRTRFQGRKEGETIRAGEHSYRAYGLAIRSEIPLPELEPDDIGPSDLAIRLRPIDRVIPEGSIVPFFESTPGAQLLAWPNTIKFLIRGANEIDVDPVPGIDPRLIRLPLLGAVMALVLHLRGMLVLHASAVGISDRSAIFLGDKQAGKSTTAAALVAAGHRLLADDVVAIGFSASGAPRIVPGFPQLKLNPDAAKSVIGDAAAALPLVLPGFEKRQHRLAGPFSGALVSPTRIYVLARAPTAALSPLAMGDGLIALIRYSYVTRFRPSALLGAAAGLHLKQCAVLATSAPLYRLEVPASLANLSDVVRLIESDLMETGR